MNEAAASGLPILVSETVGARYELVEERKNGILFDPHSIDQIAKAMLTITGCTEEERAAMGQRSREIVADWSPKRFGEGLFAAINAARSS